MLNLFLFLTFGSFDSFTDKYFLRTKEVLRKDGLNPYVRAQVFIRNGPGIIAGLDEAVKLIRNNSPLEKNGGKIPVYFIFLKVRLVAEIN